MKKSRVSISNCSGQELITIAKKSGFSVFEGGRHTKVKTSTGEFVTMIPRHTKLNKFTVSLIVKDLNKHGANVAYS